MIDLSLLKSGIENISKSLKIYYDSNVLADRNDRLSMFHQPKTLNTLQLEHIRRKFLLQKKQKRNLLPTLDWKALMHFQPHQPMPLQKCRYHCQINLHQL